MPKMVSFQSRDTEQVSSDRGAIDRDSRPDGESVGNEPALPLPAAQDLPSGVEAQGRATNLTDALDRAPPSYGASQKAIRRLIGHANDLLRLAVELDRGASPAMTATSPTTGAAGTRGDDRADHDHARWLEQARRTYRARRSRAELFGDETLFGEPAWDILLDLFIAAKSGKRVPVTSACIGAAVPTTTALRWLTLLEERGLVVREADDTDARRVFVRLSADAYARMVGYFTRAANLAEGEEVG